MFTNISTLLLRNQFISTDHLKKFNLKKNHPFYNRLSFMLGQGIKPQVIILRSDLSEKDAYLLEEKLILEKGRKHMGTGPLLNLSKGGEMAFRKPKGELELIIHPDYTKEITDDLPRFCKEHNIKIQRLKKNMRGDKGFMLGDVKLYMAATS